MALDSSDLADLARLCGLRNHCGAVLALAGMYNTPTSTVGPAISQANAGITSPTDEIAIATNVETAIIATTVETPVESTMEILKEPLKPHPNMQFNPRLL
jgi:hypothetical protein